MGQTVMRQWRQYVCCALNLYIQTNQQTRQLALTALSPWQWYTSTRTFANSFETTLTIMALSWWPWTWFIEAPASDGMQMNVLDDGPSLE
jgi:hypothetical protein